MVLLHPVVAGRTRAAGKLRRGSGSLRRLPSGEVRSTTIVPTRVAKKVINSELWHACAGPLVCLPQRGSLVYYFPQGHSEQVAATTKKTPNSRIPNYPSLPSQLLCQVHNITMHDTDEVYVQMTLQPVNSETDVFPIPSLGSYAKSKHPAEYFCKLKHRRGSWLHLLSGICNFSIWSLVSLVIMVVFLTLIDVACG